MIAGQKMQKKYKLHGVNDHDGLVYVYTDVLAHYTRIQRVKTVLYYVILHNSHPISCHQSAKIEL